MFRAGRDLEQCAGDLHHWISAHDLEQHEREIKKPNTFNKVFRSGAIEKQAIEIYAAKKKLEKQRQTLKNHIVSIHGLKGWDELIFESKLRRQRTEAIYAQRELRREK